MSILYNSITTVKHGGGGVMMSIIIYNQSRMETFFFNLHLF